MQRGVAAAAAVGGGQPQLLEGARGEPGREGRLRLTRGNGEGEKLSSLKSRGYEVDPALRFSHVLTGAIAGGDAPSK